MDEMAIKPCVKVDEVGILALVGTKVMDGGIELVFLLRCEANPIRSDTTVREMMQTKFGLPETMRDIEDKLVVKFNRVIAQDAKLLKRQAACKMIAREVRELMKYCFNFA